MIVRTGTTSTTLYFDEAGERIYPCRCGHIHRGPYGALDYDHHMCFHNSGPLCEFDPVDDPGHFVCSCGQSFFTDERWHAK